MNHRSLPGELHDDDRRPCAAPPSRGRPPRRPGWPRLSGLVAAAALAALGCGAGSSGQPAASASQPAAVMTPAQIAARATPAVVTIRGDGSLGAGFLIREDGWIATNFHVIAGIPDLKVVLWDESEHPVLEVLAFDEERDLAIVRIHAPRKLPLLPLGDSLAVRPGDPVVAIGHPLGLADTVSNGLVSAVRVVDPALTLLQISAPIAPGSSGGPLFNERGEVIGVAAAVATQGQNLNFGVPADYLKKLLVRPDPVPLSTFAAETAEEERALPAVKRSVPHHALSVLRGCTEGDLLVLARTMDGAIQVGSPLYNEGDFASCYHIYEGAALDMERRIGRACRGPKQALAEGRRKAAVLDDNAAQAWAMRDAFDGLLDVILRKVHGDPG
ncbi:S1C family serine protease [Sorangium cellulosum]|uniref:Serine protease n=1 Tax=Sorangium cellulosum TaxID=56 RepID=A0A150QJX4_SORCE|nr:trypsin-like peptidase domain-containing protein [Sorangium cellulosum]KYF68281.1 serine protease [Sorangium cellulosum]